MPKILKKNGFCVFMDEKKAQVIAERGPLERGKRDLALLVSDDWKALSVEEKARYNERAKKLNERIKLQRSRDSAAGGSSAKPPSPPKKPVELEVPKEMKDMEAGRAVVSKLFENQAWVDQSIVICSFNTYFEPEMVETETQLPAEVGLTAFTLKHGVMDNFARIIDPVIIPEKREGDLQKGADELGIPFPGTVPEFSDHKSLLMSMTKFLEMYGGNIGEDGDLHVFAFDSDYIKVRGCLDWLLAKHDSPVSVKVLSLNQWAYLASTLPTKRDVPHKQVVTDDSAVLLVSPYRTVGKSLVLTFIYPVDYPLIVFGVFKNEGEVDSVVKGLDNYKYLEELCCMYHLKSGEKVQNCALNMSNRFAYSLLEILTISNDIPIQTGGHFPQSDHSPEAEKATRYGMLLQWGITQFEREMDEYSPDKIQGPGSTTSRRQSKKEYVRREHKKRDKAAISDSKAMKGEHPTEEEMGGASALMMPSESSRQDPRVIYSQRIGRRAAKFEAEMEMQAYGNFLDCDTEVEDADFYDSEDSDKMGLSEI